MKERLVEDWLIRINERGYEVPFCESLLAKRYRVLRCGHSPTEHGKDVLAIAPDGVVCAYQLKTGDIGQAEINRYHDQLNMLVEARPIHPGLPASFDYRPFLVSTGEFKEPAISLIKELNAGWQHLGRPILTTINGRQLHVDFLALSSDFWPVEAPAVRRFRELYLVDGRGDLDMPQYASFLNEILRGATSASDLERRVAAANIFASYLLGDFYKQQDHFSVFQSWTVCAAQIAWAGEGGGFAEKHWRSSFELAKQAAADSLKLLTDEVLSENAFRVRDWELDDLTRTRNTVALAAAACWQLITNRGLPETDGFRKTLELTMSLRKRGRLFFWGEGALSHFLMLIWLLEHGNEPKLANELLMNLIVSIAQRNARGSPDAFEDPYCSPDECLAKLFANEAKSSRPQAVESYSLFPLVLIAARRDLRSDLERIWLQISRVDITWFKPEEPADTLRWHCDKGKEYQGTFDQPQSWNELREVAFRDDQDRLPVVLRDVDYGRMFMLAFPHRALPSLTKHLDKAI